MLHKNEQNLISIIRYAPVIIIIFLSIFITYWIEYSNNIDLEKNIQRTTKFYLTFNNDELEEEVDRVYEYIEKEDKNSLINVKTSLQKKVYEAHDIASNIYKNNKEIKTNKEILDLIRTALRSIIFNNGRGYYFINDIHGMNLLQPLNTKIENTNILEIKDVNGYQFMKTINQSIKDKSERFDTYYWVKNAEDNKSYEKISFYKYFEPLNISIGTGEYIADYEKELKTKVIAYIQNIKLDDDGYIFMTDYSGSVLSHKNINNLGKNLIHLEDKNNFEFVKELINIGKKGDGFITYYNSTLSEQAYKKTSFVKGYDKWEWVFGTGYSEKDLLEILEKVKKDLVIVAEKDFYRILYGSILVTSLLLIFSLLLSKYLEKIFVNYKIKIKNESKYFENFFEYSNIGLSICNKEGHFVKVNKKLIEIFNYNTKEELLNKFWSEVSHHELIDNETKVFNELQSGDINTYTLEKKYLKKDGTQFDAIITANTLKNEDNSIAYILFSIIDISDIKAQENALFQQSKMASMGEMLANIAHQWRQPLSLISTASSGLLVQKEHNIMTDSNFHSSLESIEEATQYLSHTIEDFKNFFQPDENKIDIYLQKVVDKSLKLVSSVMKNKDIKFIQNIDDINFKSFENDLVQVFINLLNNAKDAFENRSGDKFIFISNKLLEDEKLLVLSIKDNAGGIPSNIIDKVFEPYFTTKHKDKGTGIGLYMVNEIITKHTGGTITVQNVRYMHEGTECEGVEFKISIPLS